jgi:CRISPR-associated protein Cmr5
MQTMGQKRAAFALNAIIEITSGMNEKQKKEFKSFTAGVPSMILQNGFGQALAFFLAKKEKKYEEVFTLVKEWLAINNHFAPNSSNVQFMQALAASEQSRFFELSKETMALLEWVKRFAAMQVQKGDQP